jgi:hypothetical protein
MLRCEFVKNAGPAAKNAGPEFASATIIVELCLRGLETRISRKKKSPKRTEINILKPRDQTILDDSAGQIMQGRSVGAVYNQTSVSFLFRSGDVNWPRATSCFWAPRRR